jgi:proline dehydrogenase
VLRSTILAASRNKRVENLITHAPVSRSLVHRFVGGSDTASAVDAAQALVAGGLTVTLGHLGEDTTDRAQADAVVEAYVELLGALKHAGLTTELGPLTARSDVSVKLCAIGQALPGDGQRIALDNARRICAAAAEVGASVTLDAEDHTTTDSTLAVLAELRPEFPRTAAVLQAYLHRTLGDCRDLAGAGSRVRLCKGAYREPASVAYQKREEVDLNYVRCVNVLLGGAGYPMFATHDPRLVAIAGDRALWHGRKNDEFEFQMLYGIRPDEQRRLAAIGHTVRVYIPYGAQWYGYLMRRLAERPANLAFFGRALVSKG